MSFEAPFSYSCPFGAGRRVLLSRPKRLGKHDLGHTPVSEVRIQPGRLAGRAVPYFETFVAHDVHLARGVVDRGNHDAARSHLRFTQEGLRLAVEDFDVVAAQPQNIPASARRPERRAGGEGNM